MKMNENLNIILGISLTFKKYELICIFIKKKKTFLRKANKTKFFFSKFNHFCLIRIRGNDDKHRGLCQPKEPRQGLNRK